MDICIVKTMNVVARIYDRFVGLAVCLEISSSQINLNESFRDYYIHLYEDYVKRFFRKFV